MKYYFQLAEKNPVSENWEQIKAHEYNFDKREDAVSFAKYMAALFCTKVRLTDNSKLLQGTYFHS